MTEKFGTTYLAILNKNTSIKIMVTGNILRILYFSNSVFSFFMLATLLPFVEVSSFPFHNKNI